MALLKGYSRGNINAVKTAIIIFNQIKHTLIASAGPGRIIDFTLIPEGRMILQGASLSKCHEI